MAAARPHPPHTAATHREIRAGHEVLEGDLVRPEGAMGLVIFVHGSGSGRKSPRNRHVAGRLQRAGLATLLLDLLTREEERIDAYTAQYRFDIGLLTERLEETTVWAGRQPELADLKVGLFGASTGAAAALMAAAEKPDRIAAVVSRGGRPDLAGEALPEVKAPTLLIVGGADDTVVELNRAAYARLEAEKSLVIVPGASHLFEEPGALDTVSDFAARWFARHLGGASAPDFPAD